MKHKTNKGSVLVVVGMMILVFIGFGALSIDLSHLFLVRDELQNAADSIALAGAKNLFPSTADGPNWAVAQTKAQEAVPLLKVDNVALIDATIETGYWDLTQSVTTIQTITPPTVPGANLCPAVKVTLSKAAGQNGGPVPLLMGYIFGIPTADITVKATAISGTPAVVESNLLFPVVLPLGLYSQFWDLSEGQPKIDPATGQTYVFHISNSGTFGNWTSFELNTNSASAIKALLSSGNPHSLKLGDLIWVQPGVKTTIYNDVPADIDVMIAIVNNTTSNIATPIVGFGAMHIHFAVGGSGKYIQVNLIKDYKSNQTSPGGGANFGAYSPPKLAY